MPIFRSAQTFVSFSPSDTSVSVLFSMVAL